MRRRTVLVVGAVLVGAVCGCSSDGPAPGSTISQPIGGSGGAGGESGSLALGITAGAGGGGGSAGASGGSTGASAGTSAEMTQGGTSAGGVTSHAGSGAGGSGGAKPAGMCKRSAGSDADCADFYPGDADDIARPQAYACDDTGAASMLSGAHGGKCASVSFVSGAKYGMCCPP